MVSLGIRQLLCGMYRNRSCMLQIESARMAHAGRDRPRLVVGLKAHSQRERGDVPQCTSAKLISEGKDTYCGKVS